MQFQHSLSRRLEHKQFPDCVFEEVLVRKQGDESGTRKKMRKSYKRNVGPVPTGNSWETVHNEPQLVLSWRQRSWGIIHTALSLAGALSLLLDSCACLRQEPFTSVWFEGILKLRVSHPCSRTLYVCTEWQHLRSWVGLRQRFFPQF